MIENKLFYSSPTDKSAKKYAQVFLRMSDYYERRFEKKDKSASVSDPPTPEMLAEFRRYLSEGYVIRDVCIGPLNDTVVIFEREIG